MVSERPSTEAYEDLVLELSQLTNSIGKEADQLKVSIDALHAVLDYLHDDAALYASEVCQPLVNILCAAEDVLRGANAPLLQRRPIKGGGAPTDLWIHRTRAFIVLALETMISAGSSLEEAACLVMRELKEIGMINPKSKKEYSLADLMQLTIKAHDYTGPKKLIDHLAALKSAEAKEDLAMVAIQNDPKKMAWNLLKAAALISPTSEDAEVIVLDSVQAKSTDRTPE